jgi:hypothetical protein
MAQLTNLPAETLTRIMQECPDIESVLRLASINRLLRKIWHLNTIAVTCAVLEFTQSELLAALELSKIEASTPEQGDQSAAQEINLNHAVRQYLFWIARIASATQAVYQHHLRDKFLRSFGFMEDQEGGLRPGHLPLQEPTWSFSEVIEAIIMLRRFAVGVNHPSTLRAAYLALQHFSDDDINRIVEITKAFQGQCMANKEHMVIGSRKKFAEQRQEEIAYQSDPANPPRATMITAWGCADNMIRGELWWRPAAPGLVLTAPPDEVEEAMRLHYEDMCNTCGKEFVRAAYGGDEIPWTIERAARYPINWQPQESD